MRIEAFEEETLKKWDAHYRKMLTDAGIKELKEKAAELGVDEKKVDEGIQRAALAAVRTSVGFTAVEKLKGSIVKSLTNGHLDQQLEEKEKQSGATRS